MPRKFTADRGKGAREHGLTVSEVNINMIKREAHLVFRITDALDYEGAEHVVLLQEPEFSAVMTTAGGAAPLFADVADIVLNHVNSEDKALIVLGRPPAVDEVIPDWTEV